VHINPLVANLLWALRGGSGSVDVDHQETLLRSLLRSAPTWALGHRYLSEVALRVDNIQLAYSSAVIYERLVKNTVAERSAALALLGRCFLRRGECDRSLEYFMNARALAPATAQLSEDIAAAYVLKGMHSEACKELQSINPDELSAEGKAALSFVKGKL